MLSLMDRCNFCRADVVSVMSHAIACLLDVFPLVPRADESEQANVACLQCYISHCLLIDEPCSMKYWRKFVFRSSNMRMLDGATMKLMKIQGYNFRVSLRLVDDIRQFLNT